jgi:hypothetical protein
MVSPSLSMHLLKVSKAHKLLYTHVSIRHERRQISSSKIQWIIFCGIDGGWSNDFHTWLQVQLCWDLGSRGSRSGEKVGGILPVSSPKRSYGVGKARYTRTCEMKDIFVFLVFSVKKTFIKFTKKIKAIKSKK